MSLYFIFSGSMAVISGCIERAVWLESVERYTVKPVALTNQPQLHKGEQDTYVYLFPRRYMDTYINTCIYMVQR